jgi:2-phospho-L-lactate transferase/gluconeogenesis factor (CofD/UPF0052 family)
MGGMVRFLKLCENADGKLRKTMIVIDLFDYLSKRSAQLKGLLRTSPKFLQTLEVKLEDLSEDIRNLTHSSNRLTDLEGCSETPSDTPVQVYHKMEEMYHELWNLSAEEKLSVRSRYEESIIEPRNAIHEVRKYHLSKGIEV